ncbi:hypothetical protein AcW1_002038 [Taiwanofungus camphoratus]|nr:hypothetical protein AcW1_002038 [Antrodia cinnamomea]KAI0945935.1 hypothetical protein AcV7_010045 [Antrodia cinnamomea]
MPPLSDLATWTEGRVRNMMTANTQEDFDSAFEAFLSKGAHITVNGKHISRHHYKERMQTMKSNEMNVKITFNGTVAAPVNTDSPTEAGTVGLFYTAVITTHLIKSSTISSSLNVVIVQDPSLKDFADNVVDFDARRVSTLSEVVVDSPQTGLQPGIASTVST